MAVLVEFSYNGSNEITATLHGVTVGLDYTLCAFDPASSCPTETATADPFVMVTDDIGGIAAGDHFAVYVAEDDFGVGRDYIACAIFEIGSTDQYDLGAVWSFDGNDEISVTFPSILGQAYKMRIEDPVNGESSHFTPTGTGSPLTITDSADVSPIEGDYFAATLSFFPGAFKMEATRLFQAGFASAGTDGQGTEAPPTPPDPFGPGRFYEAPPWRFIVTNLVSETQTWLDKLGLARAVTFTRGQPTTISVDVPADNPEVNILALDDDAFVSEGTRLLFAFRRDGGSPPWRIRAATIILGLADHADSDHSVSTLTGYDSREILKRRPVTIDVDGNLPSDANGLVYLAATPSEILVEQLDFMLAFEGAEATPFYHAGLDWGWSAYYNGTIETTETIDEMTFSRGTSIGELMDKLEETGTCDLVIDPVWDPFNRPGIIGQLSIYQRAGAVRRNAIFGWDRFPKNVVGVSRVVDGRERVNHVQFYAGQGGPPVSPYEDAAAVAKFGRYFAQQFFPGQVSVAAVEAISQRVLALQKNGQTTFTLSPAAERAPVPLTDYSVFDTVPVHASNRLRRATSELLRVESIPVVIGDDQLERVSEILVSIDSEFGVGS